MPNDVAKFIPVNRQEHENEIRTIIGKHMGDLSGNPTQWVVSACMEAFQRGFGLGFQAGSKLQASAPPPPPYREQIGALPSGQRLIDVADANIIENGS